MGMHTHHTIVIGDSRRMSEVADNSVHLIVTSPPYWQLKDYGCDTQIGFDDTYEDYINNLNLVWKECYRVLHPGCRMIINIGDQFARSVYYGRYKIIPIRTEIIKFLETIGMDYMGGIIWHKKTTMNTTGGATVMGSYPYPRNGIVEIDYEFIMIFKKIGEPPKIDAKIKEDSKLTKEEWCEYFSGHWNFGGVKQNRHIAMFPEELPKRLIKMFTFKGETVLDPFLGSGTTSLAAENLQRNSIGYEINKDFLSIIKEKLSIDENSLLKNAKFQIVHQTKNEYDWKSEIQKLPYIFKDMVKIDKKVDPRKLRFGSKISINEKNKKQDVYSLKEILSPELIELDNGIKVRLLGIKSLENKIPECIHFIKLKTKGQKIHLKFDEQKYDDEGNLLAYIYTKNKTFINTHLIKNGFSDVDESLNFKYKNKFLSLKSLISR